jgi:hypothetical protein
VLESNDKCFHKETFELTRHHLDGFRNFVALADANHDICVAGTHIQIFLIQI